MPDASASAAAPCPAPPPPLPSKPASKLRWRLHFTLVASLPLVAAAIGLAQPEGTPALSSDPAGLLWVCLSSLGAFGAVLGLACLISKASAKDLLLTWRPRRWVVPLGLLYSIGLRVGPLIVYAMIALLAVASGAASPASVQRFFTQNSPHIERLLDLKAMGENSAYFWLNVTVVSVVIGGLREEFWRSAFIAGLRHLWPDLLERKSGQIACAAIAAVFFGIGHLPQGLFAAATIGLIGFGLGIAMVLHRSIWPSVVAHSALDAASMALVAFVVRHPNLMQHIGR